MRRLVLMTVLLSMVLALSSCGGDDPPSESSSGGGSFSLPTPEGTDTAAVDEPFYPPEDSCAEASEEGYDVAVAVTTTSPLVVPYLDDFVLCTDGTDTGPMWLRNKGKAVWRLPIATKVKYLDFSAQAKFFEESFSPDFDQPMLLPGDVAVIEASPSDLRWTIDVARTVTWDVQSGLVDEGISYGGAKVADVLRVRSSTRAAVATCSLAAFQVVRGWDGGPEKLEEQVGFALTAASGGVGCASSWDRAWSRRLQPSAGVLGEVDTTFSRAMRFARLARVLSPVG